DFSRRGVTVLLDPSDENTRTPIEAAVTAGVLQRDGLGGYRETYSPHAPAQAPQQAPQQQPEQETPMAPEDQIISSVSNNLGVAWQSAAASILAGKPADIGNISRATGLEENFVRESLEYATAALHHKAFTAAKAVGLSPTDYDAMRAWS